MRHSRRPSDAISVSAAFECGRRIFRAFFASHLPFEGCPLQIRSITPAFESPHGKYHQMKNAVAMRSPLRWAGSKRKSVPELMRYAPARISTYIEPFAGSACLAFALASDAMVLSDINPRLVEFYEHLRDDPERLHAAYAEMPSNRDHYYRVRASYNAGDASLERAAQFLYLNRHCFNGLYRVNKRGEFNVPWGGDSVSKPLSKEILLAASRALQRAKLICGDFESVVLDNIGKDSFVYLNPPYLSDTSRVFCEYHENSLAARDWNRFDAVLREIDQAGGHFLLSYAGASLEARFKNWNVKHVDVTRIIGGSQTARHKEREFIAMNFTPDA